MSVLIITDSDDATADVVVEKLGGRVFRLNTDLINEYTIEIVPLGFDIASPSGRTISTKNLSSVYWRKPFCSINYDRSSQSKGYFYSEARYLVREIFKLSKLYGAHSLVEPFAEYRLGKMVQLSLARRYFSVPSYRVSINRKIASSGMVVKSLSGEELDSDHVLYTTSVEGVDLDENEIWFSQQRIEKKYDVTIVYIKGRCFSFRLEGTKVGQDWRESIETLNPEDWETFSLDALFEDAVRSYMSDCALSFGRLDFVQSNDGFLHFLEVNPNGQWAWLDLQDRVGLVSAVVAAL